MEMATRGWALEVAAGPENTSTHLLNKQVDAPFINIDGWLCINLSMYACMYLGMCIYR